MNPRNGVSLYLERTFTMRKGVYTTVDTRQIHFYKETMMFIYAYSHGRKSRRTCTKMLMVINV